MLVRVVVRVVVSSADCMMRWHGTGGRSSVLVGREATLVRLVHAIRLV